MISFDKLWETMAEKGVSTYQLRERCGIDSKTVRRLRANENIEKKTLDKLCAALSCRLEDIAEYRSEDENIGSGQESLRPAGKPAGALFRNSLSPQKKHNTFHV